MKTQPAWLDKKLFPFESKWIEIEGNQLHYIDEGKDEEETILFVHGTPEWSFGWRDLVKELRNHYRCIALDMLGFGLSDKPKHGDYTCKAHSDRLELFIHRLGLTNFNLMANDFGGGISLRYVVDNPTKVKKIMLFNTWMWSLKTDKHYSGPAKVMNTMLGKIMYLNFNFPVNVVMAAAFGDKKKLTKEIHAHYKKALPNAASRVGAYTFAKELTNASDWWQSYWDRMNVIADKPFLIFWGMKDSFIPPKELEKWKSKLPSANVVMFEDAGHFVQEEKPKEMIREIREFLK
ncbi:MAG: alpha/beta fold hydrolase [Bacteroidota bacterium]